jgi:hypothetical protein
MRAPVAAATLLLLYASGCGWWNRCGEGMAPGEGGVCELVLTEAGCGPGTMPRIGFEGCAPAGWTSCPEGFEPGTGGWGCRPIVAASCDEHTMARIGATGCAALGRCNARFPPDDATHYVDPDLTDAELGPRHFRSIIGAVEAAPAGAVIAIADGLYLESVVVDKRLRLVGRCPQRAGISTSRLGYPGLTIVDAQEVTIEGLFVRDAHPGLYVGDGAGVTLRDVLLLGNEGAGLYTTDGAAVHLERSVAGQTLPYGDGTGGWGVLSDAGSRVTLVDSVLDRNHEAALFVLDAGTEASVTRSIIRATHGRAVAAQGGAVAILEESGLIDNRGIGIFAADPGTEIHLLATAVEAPPVASRPYRGASIQDGARLVVAGGVIDGMREVALFVSAARAEIRGLVIGGPASDLAPDEAAYGVVLQGGAVMEADGLVVRERKDAGILVREESTLNLEGSLVSGTAAWHADPIGVVVLGTAQVSESTLDRNAGAGVAVYSGGRLTLDRVLIRGSSRVGGIYGHGALVLGGHLEAWRSRLDRSEGIALAATTGRALVDESVLAGNDTALHVVSPVMIREADAPRPPEENEVVVTRSTRFIDNATRLGAGQLVIPVHAGLED